METEMVDGEQGINTLENDIDTNANTSRKYVMQVSSHKEKCEEEEKIVVKHPHQPPFEKMTTNLLPVDRYEGATALDELFRNEDKTLVFARDTFCEEFLVHNLHAFIGPILLPLYKKICSVGGLKITGFVKSRLPKGTTNYSFYHSELQRWYSRGLHLVICLLLINLRTEENEYFLKTFPESSVLPFMCIYLPILNIIVRSAIIAVKYAYLPRAIMRSRRENGVDMDLALTDLIALWIFLGASRDAVISRLKLACWRAGLSGNEMLTFVDDISPDLWKKLDMPEKKLEVDEKANANLRKHGYSEEYFSNELLQIENEKKRLEKAYVPTNKIPLIVILKYISCKQTESALTKGMMRQYVGLQFLLPLLPLVYLGIYHDIALKERSITSYVLEGYVLLVGMRELSGFSTFFFAFPLLPSMIFDRYRNRLNMIFELLIPSRIADARRYDIDKTTSTNLLKQLPPLAPTCENVLMWNEGRRAMQKFGLYYRKRSEVFMGFYIIVLVGLSIQQVITLVFNPSDQNKVMVTPSGSSFLHGSENEKKVGNASTSLSNQTNVAMAITVSIINEGTIIISFLAILFAHTILKVIMSGILMNRQRKLLLSSLKSHLVRVKKDSIRQVENCKRKGGTTKASDMKVGRIEKEAAQYHKAIKVVDGEMEAEEITEKARILGFTVDVTMLEMILAILSTTAYTLYDMAATR